MSQSVRVLLMLIALLFGVIVGIVAGILAVVDGSSLPSAIAFGTAGGAGATIFVVAAINFVVGMRP